MSLVFEEQYAVEWCVNEAHDNWDIEEECDSLDEAKQLVAWDRQRHPNTKFRIAVRYVSEWKPWGGE